MLDLGDVLRGLLNQFLEIPLLQSNHPLFGIEDFLFIFFELGSDVALCVDQSLLSDPLRRDFILVSMGHFKIIAEDLIIGDFKGGNPRILNLTLLDLNQKILAFICQPSVFIELSINPIFNHSSLMH